MNESPARSSLPTRSSFREIVIGLREAGYDYKRISRECAMPLSRILDVMHWGRDATRAELAALQRFNDRTKQRRRIATETEAVARLSGRGR
ncbi:hypothetical protein GOD35_29650 [Sinorhizobium medicae]|nr:hypothetical protein [Sinorhizobium medicae]